MEISAEGYAVRTVATGLPSDGAVLADVALAGTAVVDGSVTDQLKGQAIADVGIGLQGMHLEAQTGPGGKFVIAAVPPGNHTLRASRDGVHTSVEHAAGLENAPRPFMVPIRSLEDHLPSECLAKPR